MIQSITITNHQNESLVLELGSPEKSGLLVKKIEGLGPAKTNFNTTELATTDGVLMNSMKVESRNIVFTFAMMFAPTIEDSRLLTYRYFPLKRKIRITFVTKNRNCYVDGYVESNTPDIFNKEETTQISLICPDPYFYEINEDETVFSGIESLFEFPFSNESLTENLLELSAIRSDTRAVLNYKGDVDTGVYISIHCIDIATNIVLYNINTNERFVIDTDRIEQIVGKPFSPGDDIYISTKRGEKSMYMLSEGVSYNIISALDYLSSTWFQLIPGDNIFAYNSTEGIKNLLITFTYYNAYGGI